MNNKKRLCDLEAHQKHKEKLIMNQKKRLCDLKAHQKHKQTLIINQKKRLCDLKAHQKHKQTLIINQKKRLSDLEAHKKHKEKLIINNKKRLRDLKAHKKHKEQLIMNQKKRLNDDTMWKKHKIQLKVNQKKRLLGEDERRIHNLRQKLSQVKRLRNNSERMKHNMRIRAYRLNLKRLNDVNYKKVVRNQKKKYRLHRRINYKEQLFIKYRMNIKLGADNICESCDRLMYKKQMKNLNRTTIDEMNLSFEFIKSVCINATHTELNSSDCIIQLCQSCYRQIVRKTIPTYSLYHEGLRFFDVPDSVLKLSFLEERFISPRIPFMKIFKVGMNQYKVQGSVINVPTDVCNSVTVLPRAYNETQVIPIALKKKKSYKSNVFFETVSPNNIFAALHSLKNCEVYKHCEIKIDFNRPLNIDTDLIRINNRIEPGFDKKRSDLDDQKYFNNSAHQNVGVKDNVIADDEFDSDEEEEPVNVREQETLLQNNQAIIFTPGEGNIPMSLIFDQYAEEMTFMKIYGGNLRKKIERLAYHDIVKSEIMRSDRRCANVMKLLYCALKIRILRLSSSIAFHMRKSIKQDLVKEDLLNDNIIRDLIIHDSGFKVFATDRGSPAFFEGKKKDVFAMIRQLGPANLFLTLSAAETRWLELLVILAKVVDDKIMTEEQAKQLTYKERVRLINTDPVTCARYFEQRVSEIFKLLKHKNGIFDEHNIKDYYVRVEFQHRGSPHVHTLLWLNNAPNYEKNNRENVQECINFIDRYITCDTKNLDDELISYQTHKHTRSCERIVKGNKTCRFSIPYFPMPETMILEPLPKIINEDVRKAYIQKLRAIETYLNKIFKSPPNVSFEEYLNTIEIENVDEYIEIVRFSLRTTKIFLKRLPCEIRINGYNKDILELHQANIDVQFITNTYACVQYVCNYINKSSKGISKLMADVMKEIHNRGNVPLREKMKIVANKFVNASEVSAQEAVYYCLSMAISKSSKACIFINTSHPEKRVRVVKSKKDLANLPVGSTDVYCKDKLDHYCNRPQQLENICLADFLSKFVFTKTVPKRNQSINNETLNDSTNVSKIRSSYENELFTEEKDDDFDDVEYNESVIRNVYTLEDKSGYIYAKRNRSIIRYINYNKDVDPTSYYREQLMLFHPWRNEERELINVDHKSLSKKYQTEILKNKQMFVYYNQNNQNIEDIIDEAEKDCDNNNSSQNVHQSEDDAADEYQIIFDDDRETNVFIDVGLDTNRNIDEKIGVFPIPNILNNNDYLDLMRSLNEKQRRYLLNVLNHFKNDTSPTYEIVLGGAGVGKSRLINAIQQSLLHYYHSKNAASLDNVNILLTASTGKAAFNINGITLHSAFALPLNQCAYDMPHLSATIRNKIFSKLHDLKLIIIDEISMVGSKMFHQIDIRLKQIFNSEEDFGGISIIAFGDFNQLPPVGDSYIFEADKSNPYADIAANTLWEKFHAYELNEIMRQKDDAAFANSLNRLAHGLLNKKDIEMFKSREINETTVAKPVNCLHLYSTNIDVDAHNRKCLQGKDKVLSQAIDRVADRSMSEETKNHLLEMAKLLKLSNSYGLPYSLELACNIHYMVTNNVDVEDGLVNGAIGILKYIEYQQENIVRVWLLFDQPNTGNKARRLQNESMQINNIPIELTPIQRITRPISVRKKHSNVTRKQFPLTPAEAITVHKSQGSTYNTVVINPKKLNRHGLYVACSRATSLKGLFIDGVFRAPKAPGLNDKVTENLKVLFENRSLNFTLKFLQDYPGNKTLFYCNAQSLCKHMLDLVADNCFTTAKILVVVETWSKASDKLDIPNFKPLFRADNESKRKPYGIIIYASEMFLTSYETLYSFNSHDDQISCNMVAIEINKEIILCGLYISPKTPYMSVRAKFLNMLETVSKIPGQKTIVIGDFNVNLNDRPDHPVFIDLHKHQFELKSTGKSSTNANTKIDLCFAKNSSDCHSFYYENYFGHHKPINVIFENNHGDILQIDNSDKNISNERINNSTNHDHDYNIKKINANQTNSIVNSNVHEQLIPNEKENINRNGNDGGVNFTRINDILKNLNGFINENVACYANAMLQCLLHSDYIRNIMKQNPNNEMFNLSQLYEVESHGLLDSINVRREVEYAIDGNRKYSSITEMHDTCEFFDDLIDTYFYLQHTIGIVVAQYVRCKHCRHNFELENINEKKLSLPIIDKERVASIQDLIKRVYGIWRTTLSDTITCQSCNRFGGCEMKQSIVDSGDVIFINFANTDIGINFQRKMTAKFQDFRRKILTINNYNYKLSSVIFHEGENFYGGHYYCYILHDNRWLKVNDERIGEQRWPQYSSNAYMLVYERIL